MIDYSFCRMLMSLSTLFNFVFESKKQIFFGFPYRPCCILRQIYQKLFISIRFNRCWLPKSFVFTGRQGVCVVPVETPASGKSGLDSGCQFGGWAVSRFIFQIATWEAQLQRIPLSHNRREICVKVVQGVFKAPWPFYWGYDGIWCRCWFKPSYPQSSSSTMETLLMITLFLRCTHSGHLEKPHAKYLSLSDKLWDRIWPLSQGG